MADRKRTPKTPGRKRKSCEVEVCACMCERACERERERDQQQLVCVEAAEVTWFVVSGPGVQREQEKQSERKHSQQQTGEKPRLSRLLAAC